MVKLVAFTDHRMTISAMKCAQSALKFGADSYSIWTPADLGQEFRKGHTIELLAEERGPMWWAWKPYIILSEMRKAQFGDIIVYCDAGNEWIADLRHAVNAMDQDILFFSNGFQHSDWCKMDTVMAILPEGVTWEKQVQASTIFLKVTIDTHRFVCEWLKWSYEPRLIDNSASILPNVSTFREHRHDQAILTCLQIKYAYRLHWFPTTTAGSLRKDHPGDTYPVLLNHHRKRNNEW